jgi:predicted metal-dependent hydrolase
MSERTCDDPPPAELLRAVEQFNRGEFFECHETLEALWLAEPGPLRRLYQGILQIGVAFHHQRRGSYRGAMNLLDAGIAHLTPFAPRCLGVDVAALLAAAHQCRAAIAALGPTRLADIDPALIPHLHCTRTLPR